MKQIYESTPFPVCKDVCKVRYILVSSTRKGEKDHEPPSHCGNSTACSLCFVLIAGSVNLAWASAPGTYFHNEECLLEFLNGIYIAMGLVANFCPPAPRTEDFVTNLKQNEAQSARAELTHKGVN